MKRSLLLSFLAMLLMLFVMRWQGQTLVSATTPRGILDLEFARTGERLQQLQAAWQWSNVKLNTLLDFIFILAYTAFFVIACRFIKIKNDWTNFGNVFIILLPIAGALDVMENVLMLLVYKNRLGDFYLSIIYYYAAIKFILVGCIILYLLISFPVVARKKRSNAKV